MMSAKRKYFISWDWPSARIRRQRRSWGIMLHCTLNVIFYYWNYVIQLQS